MTFVVRPDPTKVVAGARDPLTGLLPLCSQEQNLGASFAKSTHVGLALDPFGFDILRGHLSTATFGLPSPNSRAFVGVTAQSATTLDMGHLWYERVIVCCMRMRGDLRRCP